MEFRVKPAGQAGDRQELVYQSRPAWHWKIGWVFRERLRLQLRRSRSVRNSRSRVAWKNKKLM
jgi:hypothetical protein